jgi:hypothetical protein
MKPFSTRLVFIVWLIDSVALIWLFSYMFLHGNNSDTSQWASDLGAVWGVTVAYLIGPAWKAMKQWPARRRTFVLSGLFIIVVVAGGLFWIRARQIARLETFFKETHELSVKGAPQKQLFMKLTRENPQSLDAYLQRCAELEPALNDYETSERQVDEVMAQMQQEIGGLKPKGSYVGMLPMLSVMRAIMGKDLEGAKAYREEIQYAKQLPGIPESSRMKFYTANIEPVIEQEHKIRQDEMEIMRDAKARGVEMPDNMLQDAGIK